MTAQGGCGRRMRGTEASTGFTALSMEQKSDSLSESEILVHGEDDLLEEHLFERREIVLLVEQ